MAKDRRGKSAAFLAALRKKYGLGEFSRAATTRRRRRRVSTPRPMPKNARKVAKRAKSRTRKAKKARLSGILRNSMDWGL